MGVLAHAGHSAQPPIDESRNFLADMSAELSSNSTKSLSRKYLKLADFLPKIGLIRGDGGLTPKDFDWNLPIYVTWEPMQKFRILRQVFLGYI